MRLSIEKIETAKKAQDYIDQMVVQGISGVTSKEAYDDALEYFKERMMTPEELKNYTNKKNKIFNSDDVDQSKYAANVLQSFFSMGAQ